MAGHDGFDLTVQPWVTVLEEVGTTRDLSLLDAFESATSIRGLAGELPTQDAAVLRLMLAILHRALEPYAPQSVDEVPAQMSALREHWSETVVPAVRSYLEQHRERFDLFHPTAPFFQVAGMATAKGEVSELSKLIADMPPGRRFLTSRSARAAERLTAAEAARWLVALQAFDASGIKTGVLGHPRASGGKVYPEGVAWTGQLGLVHLLGATLAETLLLNLWAVLLGDEEREHDLPPWERNPHTVEPSPDLLTRPAGPVDLYTWQPRRVLLAREGQEVTGVLVTYGDRFVLQERQGLTHYEPMTLWRYSKPQSTKYRRDIQMTRKHRTGLALWRGIESVLPGDHSAPPRGQPPAVVPQIVEHAGRLVLAGLVPGGIIRYRAIGVEYGAQESVVDEVVEDSLDLPALLLRPDQRELRQLAIDAVESAKQGVGALAELARGLARAAGAGRDESAGPGDRAYEAGYAALDQHFRRWLRDDLASAGEDPLLAEQRWHRRANRVLTDLAQNLVAGVPEKAWRGSGPAGGREDVGAVYRRFERMMRASLPRAYPARDRISDASEQREAS